MFVATYFKTHVSCTKWWSTPSKKERKKHKHWIRNKSYRKHFFRHVMATSTISCLLNSFPSSASSHSNPPIQIERSATTVFLNSLWIQMKCRFFFSERPSSATSVLAPSSQRHCSLWKVNTVRVFYRPSFVLPSQIKCCTAPVVDREAFVIFLSVPASRRGRFRSVYGCPCQPAFLPSSHQCRTYGEAIWNCEIEKRKESFFLGFWTCQTVLLGAVGMKEEEGWRETFLGGIWK